MRTASQLDLYQKDANSLSIGSISKRCEQPLNWTYINKVRTASQLDVYQQDANSLLIALISTRCEQPLNYTYAKKMWTASQLDLCQQGISYKVQGIRYMRTGINFLSWTYVNKMRTGRSFLNWTYVNKMRTDFQLNFCQQDTNRYNFPKTKQSKIVSPIW